jgi:virginiamycin B lyase
MSYRAAIFAIVLSIFAGCSFHGASVVSNQPGVTPFVSQKGGGDQFVQFLPKTVAASYSAIVAGPDGNMWFLDENAGQVVRMSLGGSIKEFNISSKLSGSAVSMAVGADGRFYISDESTSITRVTTSGTAVQLPIPSGDGTSIDGIGLGPDGNVWFTEFSHLGMVTPAGVITEFAYPNSGEINQYGGVTAGSDGNVWYAASTQNAIGRVIPSTGKIKEFPIPVTCIPAPVVLAKDNNIWFACLTTSPQIGRITPSGHITMYAIGGTFGSNETEQFCARGPDGEPWCASGNDNTLFRVNTATHTTTVFNPPLQSGARPDAVAAGPDGNLWMDATGTGGEIDVLIPSPMTVTPMKLTFSSIGQTKTVTVSENGVTSWTPTSSNTAVATVKAGSTSSTFKVKSIGIGTCKITISDGAGNSVNVKVTVT